MKNAVHSPRNALFFPLVLVLCLLAVSAVVWDVFMFKNMKSESEVVIYPGPAEIQPSADRKITVDGKELFVFDTAVNNTRSWMMDPRLDLAPVTYFDFSGSVTVGMQVPGTKIESAVIRPLSLGIKPEIKDDTLSFKLDKPAKIVVEINGDTKRATHIFANPMETDTPDRGDPGVIYFGPGVHKVGKIAVKTNQTVYIAGGAVVYGFIKAEKLENFKIMGRGVISGDVYDRWNDGVVPINFEYCKNCSVDGVMLLNPAAWSLNTLKCENITINNVKIIGARSNSDGITTQSCRNLTATDCFVRGWDDNLVVKGYDGDAKGITFDNIVLWTDLAQSCEIGYETRANTIEDIHFKNITVLHNFHKPVLSIHNSDQALVRDVYYDNITVEDAQMGMGDGAGSNYLIDLAIRESQWSKSKVRGSIRDVHFNNINVLGGNIPAYEFAGYDADHKVENVDIRNLTVLGKPVAGFQDGKFYKNEFIKNIAFGEK